MQNMRSFLKRILNPMVLRPMGLRKLPDVSTISRGLSQMESNAAEKIRALPRSFIIEGLKREALFRLRLDFDGSDDKSDA
jgi:hypothetical protein